MATQGKAVATQEKAVQHTKETTCRQIRQGCIISSVPLLVLQPHLLVLLGLLRAHGTRICRGGCFSRGGAAPSSGSGSPPPPPPPSASGSSLCAPPPSPSATAGCSSSPIFATKSGHVCTNSSVVMSPSPCGRHQTHALVSARGDIGHRFDTLDWRRESGEERAASNEEFERSGRISPRARPGLESRTAKSNSVKLIISSTPLHSSPPLYSLISLQSTPLLASPLLSSPPLPSPLISSS